MPTVQLNNSLSKCHLQQSIDGEIPVTSVFLLANFLVGLPANVWMVWLICHGTSEMLSSEIYLLSLAVCEILYCLGLPAQLYCLYNFEEMGPDLAFILRLHFFLLWIGRPIFQTNICVERYIAVVYPLLFIRFKPLKYKVVQCALIWFVFFLTSYLKTVAKDENSMLIWFVPTYCIVFFCCFSVLWSLKRPGPGQRQGEQRKGDKMKRDAFNIILVHLVTYSVNCLPAFVVWHFVKSHVSSIALNFFFSLQHVCGLVQPLHYLHRAGKLSCVKRN